MANVGFKSQGVDVDAIFQRKAEMTTANVIAMIDALNANEANLDADKVDGNHASALYCPSDCSWTCSTWCSGGANRN